MFNLLKKILHFATLTNRPCFSLERREIENREKKAIKENKQMYSV